MCDAALPQHTLGAEQVLDRDGEAFEGTRLALAAEIIGPVGLGERALGRFGDDGVEGARLFHGGHVGFRELAGAEVAGGEPIAGLRHGQSRELAHALLDHLGHDEESRRRRRCIGEDLVGAAAIGDGVGAARQIDVNHARHRRNIRGIDLVELLHPSENIGKFAREVVEIGVVDFDPGKSRNVADGGFIDRHVPHLSPAMLVRNPSELKASLNPGERLMGLDVGAKTIGIALSDPALGIATPRETLRRGKFQKDAERLLALIDEERIGGLVIGLPLNMDGSEGPRCQSVRQFAANLLARRDIRIALWDERLSTVAVTRTLVAADMSRKRRAEVVDKLAAAYILQGALDAMAKALRED